MGIKANTAIWHINPDGPKQIHALSLLRVALGNFRCNYVHDGTDGLRKLPTKVALSLPQLLLLQWTASFRMVREEC